MRPRAGLLDLLDQRSRLSAEKRTVLAERYLWEGLQMDEHPGIHFVDGSMGRRPAVLGCGLDVWEIIEVVKDNGGSKEDAAQYLELDPHLLEIAIRYYGSNRTEIDQWIERVHDFNAREEAKWYAAQEALA